MTWNQCTLRFLHYPPCDFEAGASDGGDLSLAGGGLLSAIQPITDSHGEADLDGGGEEEGEGGKAVGVLTLHVHHQCICSFNSHHDRCEFCYLMGCLQ